MATVTLGQGIALADFPKDWRTGSRRGDRRHRLSGKSKAASLEATLALQHQLLGYEGQIVPMYYSFKDHFNGFYRLNSVDADFIYRNAALQNVGLLDIDIDADHIGTDAMVEFETPMTNILRVNAMGIASDEVNFYHSPGIVGADTAYDIGNENSPGVITRAGEDGDVVVIVGIPDLNPRYRKTPATFYDGSCYAKVGGYTVTGELHTNQPANWKIGNTLFEVEPETSGGVSTGGIVVSHWDTSAYVSKTYKFMYNSTTKVPRWHAFKVIEANAERVRVQLIRDADESPATTHRHILEMQVRRGSLMVEFRYVYTGTVVNWSIDLETGEAATAVTPTGATGATGIVATGVDGNGNKFILGTGLAHTADTTNGGLDFSSVEEFTGFISLEPGSPQTQDTAANQMLQYFGKSNVMAPSVVRSFV